MSFTTAQDSHQPGRACRVCQDRQTRSLLDVDTGVGIDRIVCFDCFRFERSLRQPEVAPESPSPRSPFDVGAALSARQIAHRQAMLGHLSTAGR